MLCCCFAFLSAVPSTSNFLPWIICGASVVTIIIVNVFIVCLCILVTYRRHKQQEDVVSKPVGHNLEPVTQTTENIIYDIKEKDGDEDSLYTTVQPMGYN